MLLLLACAAEPGDDGKPARETGVVDDTGAPATVDLAGACPLSERWGGFQVEADESYALVTGIVRDGVIPADVLDRVGSSGECTLWRRTNPSCTPTCGPGETCDETGECIPFPLGQDLGTVSVAGLLVAVVMNPVEPDKSYFDTSIPNPPWVPGAVVTLTGGDLLLEGLGLDGFVPNEAAWTIVSGRPLALTWAPPPAGASSTVQLDLSIDQHGSSPLSLTCTFVDDGAGEVPAELVDQIVSSGVTGYPNGRIGRRTVDKAPWRDGCVDFVLTQPVVPDVTVSGFYPCSSEEECPPDMTCDLEREVCV